jgi:hypothetical protein
MLSKLKAKCDLPAGDNKTKMNPPIELILSAILLAILSPFWIFIFLGFPKIAKWTHRLYRVKPKKNADDVTEHNHNLTPVKVTPPNLLLAFSAAIASLGVLIDFVSSKTIHFLVASRVLISLYAVCQLCLSFNIYIKARRMVRITVDGNVELAMNCLTAIKLVLMTAFVAAIAVVMTSQDYGKTAAIVFICSQWIFSSICQVILIAPIVDRAVEQKKMDVTGTGNQKKCAYVIAAFERGLLAFTTCAVSPVLCALFIWLNERDKAWGPPNNPLSLFFLSSDMGIGCLSGLFSNRNLWRRIEDPRKMKSDFQMAKQSTQGKRNEV